MLAAGAMVRGSSRRLQSGVYRAVAAVHGASTDGTKGDSRAGVAGMGLKVTRCPLLLVAICDLRGCETKECEDAGEQGLADGDLNVDECDGQISTGPHNETNTITQGPHRQSIVVYHPEYQEDDDKILRK